jgi:hypothetical protein
MTFVAFVVQLDSLPGVKLRWKETARAGRDLECVFVFATLFRAFQGHPAYYDGRLAWCASLDHSGWELTGGKERPFASGQPGT